MIRPNQTPGYHTAPDWPEWKKYECPNPGGPWNATSAQAYTPGWPGGGGISNSYCIAAQFITEGPGAATAKGYYYKYGPDANDYSHVVSYRRNTGSSAGYGEDPVWNPPQWVHAPQKGPAIVTAPRVAPNPMPAAWPGFGGAPRVQPDILPPPGHPPLSDQPGRPRPPRPNPPRPNPDNRPNPRPNPEPQPNPRPERPPPKTKERKAALRSLGTYLTLGRRWGQITEGMDFLNAVHGALDYECQAKPQWVGADTAVKSDRRLNRPRAKIRDGRVKGANYNWRRVKVRGPNGGFYWKWVRENGYYRPPTVAEKMAAVYQNANCIDIAKAIQNIIENQVEDHLIGKANKPLGDASRKDMRPIGYGTGPVF